MISLPADVHVRQLVDKVDDLPDSLRLLFRDVVFEILESVFRRLG